METSASWSAYAILCPKSPSFEAFEEGSPRRTRKMQRYLMNRLGGGGQTIQRVPRTEVFDLPGRAEIKVAWHFLYSARPPLLEGGDFGNLDKYVAVFAKATPKSARLAS